jgi:glutamate synthase domain-containing protein 2
MINLVALQEGTYFVNNNNMSLIKKHFRTTFQIGSILLLIPIAYEIYCEHHVSVSSGIFLLLIIVGWYDSLQHKDNVRRNYPLVGSFKSIYVTERHLIVQEFLESDTEGKPFSWAQRKVVYKRSADMLLNLPFGTTLDFNIPGTEWWLHSTVPLTPKKEDLRIKIGSSDCTQPYLSSILNVSGMSYGSISKNAIMALGGGARTGRFALNTGEGGLTEWHLESGCDLIFQFGTGYFGCRNKDGNFDPDKFKKIALRPEVKMIEIKISQGAKAGYGAILPASKNTEEISKIRELEPHVTIHSPGGHTAFTNPIELMQFVKQLRELSNGKPVGFKLCMGHPHEFVAMCKAMIHTSIKPDYIVIDGGEGGTGAGDLDSINSVGMPIEPALSFAHDILTGFDLRRDIRLFGSGKIISSFDVIKFIAMGADGVNSARAMMFSLGCVQAMKCNTNECPTGVTSMDPDLVNGLVVKDKKLKVFNFHKNTTAGVQNMLAAAGFDDLKQVHRSHIYRRVSAEKVITLEELFPSVKTGALLQETCPEKYKSLLRMADPFTFSSVLPLA